MARGTSPTATYFPKSADNYDLFKNVADQKDAVPTIIHEQYQSLADFLKAKNNPALLPIQIAYCTGLRIGEVCALTWQDIDLKEQCLTVRATMGRGTSWRLGPPSERKSEPWTSATLWRIFSSRLGTV